MDGLPIALSKWLNATRPTSWTQPSPCESPLPARFSRCLKAFAALGLPTPAAHLVLTSSYLARTESISLNGEWYVIYDQGYRRILELLNGVLSDAFTSIFTHKTGLPEGNDETRLWLNILYGSRFLAHGRLNEAVTQAALLERYDPDKELRGQLWFEPSKYNLNQIAQEEFVIAHELGHTSIGGQDIATHPSTIRFRAEVAQHEEWVAMGGPQLARYTDSPVQTGLRKPLTLLSEGVISSLLLPGTRFDPIQDSQVLLESVPHIVSGAHRLSEEVLCDYLALELIIESRGPLTDDHFNDILLGCIAASSHLKTWSYIDRLATRRGILRRRSALFAEYLATIQRLSYFEQMATMLALRRYRPQPQGGGLSSYPSGLIAFLQLRNRLTETYQLAISQYVSLEPLIKTQTAQWVASHPIFRPTHMGRGFSFLQDNERAQEYLAGLFGFHDFDPT